MRNWKWMRTCVRPLLPGLAALAFAAPAVAVNINITYTDRWMNADNWPGATPAARMLNRDRATAVVNQSAANWQTSITDPFMLAVEVDWNLPFAFGNNDSGVCGVGGITETQMIGGVEKPKTGRIILNSALPNWFIDPTPALHEEFQPFPNQPWHGTATPGGPAVGNIDMLSCAKHEFGHTLGFMFSPLAMGGNGHFAPYIAEVGDLDIDTNDFGVLLIGSPPFDLNKMSHLDPRAATLDGNAVPLSDLLMSPDLLAGNRVVMSPYDISAVAKVLGLPAGMNYNLAGKGVVIPEPSALLLLACAVPLLRRR